MSDAWHQRVQGTIASLTAKAAAHPEDVYWRLCLAGWLAEQD